MTVRASQLEYKALHKPNQLIYGQGQTAVITGWTVKERVQKHLQPQEYAVIGQLYSPSRGVNLLIRNLLFNPHVLYLVVLNATKEDLNAGAVRCLLDFFRNGVSEGLSDAGRSCWVIRSVVPGYIDIEVEASALDRLRQYVECRDTKSIAEAVSLVKSYAQRGVVAQWGLRMKFDLPRSCNTVLPGQRYGHRIEGKTIAETWVKIIHLIKTTGTIRPNAYDGQWQELIDLMAIVTSEPENFYFPEPNYLPVDRSFLQEYISQILDDTPTLLGVKYTYGQRLRSHFGRDQIQLCIEKLCRDIDSARAVMSLWDVGLDCMDSPPCLNHIWVRIVDNELSMTATFRSNDMFSAWPANAMGLVALQRHIRDAIAQQSNYKLKMGPLITISQSAHIYDDCWENAENVIKSQYAKICGARDYADPAGSFVITVQDSKIFVEHMTTGSGEVVNCYSSKSATQLYRQIAESCPGMQIEHAMYLGAELQKAELALSMKQEFMYEQDKPLKNSGV